MAMVCPQCSRSYEQRLHCPSCEVRLLYHPSPRPRTPPLGDHAWRQTPWGAFLIGLLLAQGLHYVLHQLLTAGFLVSGQAGTNVWATLSNLLFLQALQVVSVFAAGVLTGAGQRRGILFGAALGVWNGILFNLIKQWTGQPLDPLSVFAEPILQATFGAIGGLVGSSIWKPVAAEPLLIPRPQPVLPVLPLRRPRDSFAGPIAWGRVLTGSAMCVGGVVWSDIIREFVLEASSGKLQIDT